MKQILIILLLFPLLGISQNRFKKVFQQADSAFIVTTHKADSIVKNKKLDDFEKKMLASVEKYIAECKKDSTLIEYWNYPNISHDNEDGLILSNTIYIKPIKMSVWKHKEPTFVGYYEWLKINK